jgi:hypothetical protein
MAKPKHVLRLKANQGAHGIAWCGKRVLFGQYGTLESCTCHGCREALAKNDDPRERTPGAHGALSMLVRIRDRMQEFQKLCAADPLSATRWSSARLCLNEAITKVAAILETEVPKE